MAVVEFSLVHMEWAMLLFCFLIYLSGNSFMVVVGFAFRGENEHFQFHLRAGIWQELSGTLVVSSRAKCISLLIRSTALCLHGGEMLTEFKHLRKRQCVLLHQIQIPLEMKPNVYVCQLLLFFRCALCYITIK